MKSKHISKILMLFLLFIGADSIAQINLSLDECYKLTEINYPLVKSKALLSQQITLENEAIKTSRLPQLNLDAQATYQSEVIQLPLPNIDISPIHKDQYRATLTANQLLFNGGKIEASLELQSASLLKHLKEVDVNLYALRSHINQLYFSILLTEEKLELLQTRQKQLQSSLEEIQAGIAYGSLLPTSDKVIEAELIKIEQQDIENKSYKQRLISSLSDLIGTNISDQTSFSIPMIQASSAQDLNRPELELFEIQKNEIALRDKLLSKDMMPQLNAFATLGYGNPGLNMLDNSFQNFYIMGLQMHWSVFDWNSNQNKRKAVAISKDLIDTQEDIFRLNSKTKLQEQRSEIDKIEAFLIKDQELIKLQQEVVSAVYSQLQNGVITASVYVTSLANLYEAENTLAMHKIQLHLAKANFNTINGY